MPHVRHGGLVLAMSFAACTPTSALESSDDGGSDSGGSSSDSGGSSSDSGGSSSDSEVSTGRTTDAFEGVWETPYGACYPPGATTYDQGYLATDVERVELIAIGNGGYSVLWATQHDVPAIELACEPTDVAPPPIMFGDPEAEDRMLDCGILYPDEGEPRVFLHLLEGASPGTMIVSDQVFADGRTCENLFPPPS